MTLMFHQKNSALGAFKLNKVHRFFVVLFRQIHSHFCNETEIPKVLLSFQKLKDPPAAFSDYQVNLEHFSLLCFSGRRHGWRAESTLKST